MRLSAPMVVSLLSGCVDAQAAGPDPGGLPPWAYVTGTVIIFAGGVVASWTTLSKWYWGVVERALTPWLKRSVREVIREEHSEDCDQERAALTEDLALHETSIARLIRQVDGDADTDTPGLRAELRGLRDAYSRSEERQAREHRENHATLQEILREVRSADAP